MTERIQISDDFFIDIIEHEKATVRVYSKKELHCHDALGRCSALDKAALAEAHIKENSLQCYHGQLYGPDGPVCDELVEAELTQTLREMDYRNGIPFAVREILKLIRGLCYQPGNLSPSPTILPLLTVIWISRQSPGDLIAVQRLSRPTALKSISHGNGPIVRDGNAF